MSWPGRVQKGPWAYAPTVLHSHNLAQIRLNATADKVARRKAGEYLGADLAKVLEEKDKKEIKREREKEKDRSRGEGKRFKGSHSYQSILELDLQIPGATTGTAYKLQEVAEADPLEVEDKFQRPNADVMFVSHWNILSEISPTESNDCLLIQYNGHTIRNVQY